MFHPIIKRFLKLHIQVFLICYVLNLISSLILLTMDRFSTNIYFSQFIGHTSMLLNTFPIFNFTNHYIKLLRLNGYFTTHFLDISQVVCKHISWHLYFAIFIEMIVAYCQEENNCSIHYQRQPLKETISSIF